MGVPGRATPLAPSLIGCLCAPVWQLLGYTQPEWDAELEPAAAPPVPTAPALPGVPGKDKGWAEMSVDEKQAAMRLGYTEDSWEDGESTEATSRPWAQLSPHELASAQVRRRARPHAQPRRVLTACLRGHGLPACA